MIIKMVNIIIKEELNMFASLLSWIGTISANVGTKGCVVWLADEPKMPKCLINK